MTHTAELLFAAKLLATCCHIAGFGIRFHFVEDVSGVRQSVETGDLSRHGWSGRVHTITTFIEHGSHASGKLTADEDVAYVECTLLHDDRHNITTPLINVCFDDRCTSVAIGVGLEFKDVGFEEDLLEKLRDVRTKLGRDLCYLILTAPVFNKNTVICELNTDREK